MFETSTVLAVSVGIIVASPIVVAMLRFLSAPYGRFERPGWGWTVPNRLGWILMESPSVVWFAWVFLQGEHHAELVPLVLLTMWQIHYVHRTFVFPFRTKTSGKRMPVLVVAAAIFFNLFNAYVNAAWIGGAGTYASDWLTDPRFVVGATLFAAGMAINVHADQILFDLRKPGETGYRIPHGGLYRWVSSPNYLGEILEWTGWAIATWSLPGLSFAIFTIANLAPRARDNHAWYLRTFDDYPPERTALVPHVW